MIDLVLVGLREALGDLFGVLQRLDLGDPPALEPLREALAGEQLHHHVGATIVGLTVLVDADRRRVPELGGDLDLAAEAGDELLVGEALAAHQLDRDVAIDLHVQRTVDDAHPALAEEARDLEAAADHSANVTAVHVDLD